MSKVTVAKHIMLYFRKNQLAIETLPGEQSITNVVIHQRPPILFSEAIFQCFNSKSGLNFYNNCYTAGHCSPGYSTHSVDSPVAFTAALSATFSGAAVDAVLPYDYVYLNHGDAYRLVALYQIISCEQYTLSKEQRDQYVLNLLISFK